MKKNFLKTLNRCKNKKMFLNGFFECLINLKKFFELKNLVPNHQKVIKFTAFVSALKKFAWITFSRPIENSDV